MPADPVALARDLIRCRSVTPDEGGALGFLAGVLGKAGFSVQRMKFSEPDTPDVENLFARLGEGKPHLAFAGHADVVPPGEERNWKYPPFAGEIADGTLYGRGAVDMKGNIACFVAAALDHAAGKKGNGTLSLIITGDEEGPAINGTRKLMAWAKARGENFDHCVLGEPTSVDALGDTLKIGRRGSLNSILIVEGVQGHAGYPQFADNPIPKLTRMLNRLAAEHLDEGSAHFQPSHLEFTALTAGDIAVNVIPGEARARLNVRYNDRHTEDGLKSLLQQLCTKAAGKDTRFRLEFEPSNAQPFVTQPGPFVTLVSEAVHDVVKRKPALSTTGGTSDARFIKDYCPVVELGLVGRTMHQVDERVPVAELEQLTAIYRRIIERYFAQ